MEAHVSGGITPLSIGELRQAILAVLFGNQLFTEEEQLLADHLTSECDDAERLARWLRNVRLQDAKRGFFARMDAAMIANQQAVCIDEEMHMTELEALMQCHKIGRDQKRLVLAMMVSAGRQPGDRLQWLGLGWLALLENMGRIPGPKGFPALLAN